ncbi:MAG: UDP-glucose/GDP-mannose dehydrogenase family protein [Candidatus Portnoybacteria bacterium]|nr:UDP-glucose/GDP-mannose dehydrogenase family protein [Candidatus Portnoybacteria bacterium]
MTKVLKIGIIGVGMVGGALERYFELAGRIPFLYDKYNGKGSREEVNEADVIFIAVPTPHKKRGGFDLSAVTESFESIRGKKIIVIKSTVWPGTTEQFQKKYPQHKVLFNPEFLSEATVDEDMRNPDVQIVGYTKTSRYLARKILQEILPRAPYGAAIPATEAEMFKYFHNVHGALKVVFANQMYDLCLKLNINYDRIKECAAASKHILTPQYLNIWHKQYRGYGGSCFPKDIRALIQFGDKIGVDLQLLKAAERVNNGLLGQQRIKNAEKPSH